MSMELKKFDGVFYNFSILGIAIVEADLLFGRPVLIFETIVGFIFAAVILLGLMLIINKFFDLTLAEYKPMDKWSAIFIIAILVPLVVYFTRYFFSK